MPFVGLDGRPGSRSVAERRPRRAFAWRGAPHRVPVWNRDVTGAGRGRGQIRLSADTGSATGRHRSRSRRTGTSSCRSLDRARSTSSSSIASGGGGRARPSASPSSCHDASCCGTRPTPWMRRVSRQTGSAVECIPPNSMERIDATSGAHIEVGSALADDDDLAGRRCVLEAVTGTDTGARQVGASTLVQGSQ